jgi:N-acetylmuramoyl-L-alanine amidase
MREFVVSSIPDRGIECFGPVTLVAGEPLSEESLLAQSARPMRPARAAAFAFPALLALALAATLLIPVALPCGAAHAAPTITAVRHWTAPDASRIVIDLSDAGTYSTSVRTGHDRIVVLVVDGSIGETPRSTEVGDGVVAQVRLNQLKSGAQVVVDLPKARPHNVFYLKPYLDKPYRIVIDVFREEPSREKPAPAPPTTPSGSSGGLTIQETANAATAEAAVRRASRPRVVVIDPGHGGEDSGTVGNGKLREKDVVLDISKKLKAELERRDGYEVHLTRTGDYFVSLRKRKTFAGKHNGDIFISVHANSAPNRKADGSEVFFVSPRGASDQAARELASRENAADLVGGVSPEADEDVLSILVDLKMTDSVHKSNDLASLVSRELCKEEPSSCHVKQAGFVVLKNLQMPSVLVEVGFLTNSGDVKKLKKSDYRTRYAHRLANAVDSYFDRYVPAPQPGVAAGTHKVAPGETLWSIARRYGLSVEQLREYNGLIEGATIHVDQVLVVQG